MILNIKYYITSCTMHGSLRRVDHTERAGARAAASAHLILPPRLFPSCINSACWCWAFGFPGAGAVGFPGGAVGFPGCAASSN